jgi:hypothetical protein
MQFARRFANSAGLAQALAAFDCMPAWAEAAMTGDQPGTVAAVAEENTPAKVFVGVYIDDIQELDLLNFGDLSEPEATDYSRLTLSIPVSRPGGGHGDQDLRANRAHRRLRCARVLRAALLCRGADRLGITALLTLVALQITSGASLPDVDYLSRPHRPSGKSAVIGLALRHSFGAVPCHALAGRMPNTEIRPLPLISRGPRSSASKWAET